jgi:hypothetical protein
MHTYTPATNVPNGTAQTLPIPKLACNRQMCFVSGSHDNTFRPERQQQWRPQDSGAIYSTIEQMDCPKKQRQST